MWMSNNELCSIFTGCITTLISNHVWRDEELIQSIQKYITTCTKEGIKVIVNCDLLEIFRFESHVWHTLCAIIDAGLSELIHLNILLALEKSEVITDLKIHKDSSWWTCLIGKHYLQIDSSSVTNQNTWWLNKDWLRDDYSNFILVMCLTLSLPGIGLWRKHLDKSSPFSCDWVNVSIVYQCLG